MSQPAALPPDLVVACSLLFGASRDLDTLDLRTLKRTYRHRALETHPDRARATGADAALLTRRFQGLTAAYESLRAHLGRTHARRGAGAPRPPTPARASTPPRAPASSRASTPPGSATPPRSTPPPCSSASPRGNASAGAGRATGPRPSAAAGPTSRARATGTGRTAQPPRAERGARAGGPTAAADSTGGDHFWGGRLPDRDLLLGQYLYYSGRISWCALIGAIHWQRTQRPHLGQLAVRAGYLAPERVRELMAAKPFEERFGDAAVRLGYLRPESRDVLVAQQRSLQRRFGTYFVEMGILPADEVQRAAVRQLEHNWSRPRDPGPGRL